MPRIAQGPSSPAPSLSPAIGRSGTGWVPIAAAVGLRLIVSLGLGLGLSLGGVASGADVAEARRALKAALDGLRPGDPATVEAAQRALVRAERELPPGDPLRGKLVQGLARAECPRLVGAGDIRGALAWATRARAAEEGPGGLPWARYAAEIARRSLPEGDVDRERAEVSLARLEAIETARGGKLDAARAALRDAVSRAAERLPGGSAEVVEVLNDAGLLALQAGDRAGALASYERASAEARRDPAGDPGPRVVAVSHALALSERTDPTGELAVELLAVVGRLPGDGPVARGAQRVAQARVWGPLLERSRGAGEGGLAGLSAALDDLAARVRAAGGSPALAEIGRLGLAIRQWESGAVAEASATLDRLAPIADDPALASFLRGAYWNHRGQIASDRFEYARAGEAFERALSAHRGDGVARLQDDPEISVVLNNLGLRLLRLGDYRESHRVLTNALACFERLPELRRNPLRLDARTNLGKALEGEGDFEGAQKLHREALAIAESESRDPSRIALCRNNLGIALYSAGEFEAARAEFEAARALLASVPGGRTAESDVNLGWAALASGETAGAASRFRAAADRFQAEGGEASPRTAEALAYLARVQLARKEPGAARASIEAALGQRERFLRRVLATSLAERDRLALVQELRVHPESSAWPGVLDIYLELAPALGIPASEQYEHVLTWKGILSRHALPAAVELEAEPGVRDLAARRETLLNELRRGVLGVDPRGAAGPRPRNPIDVEAELADVERRLRDLSPRFRRSDDGPPATSAAVRGALATGTALVEFLLVRGFHQHAAKESIANDLRYVAFVARPDAGPARVDLPADAVKVDDTLGQFREAVATANASREESGRELARLLRDPLVPHLAGVSTLIIAGDGALNHAPLAALPGSAPGRFWAEELAMSWVPSAVSILSRRRPHPPGRGALLVGGVAYGEPGAPWKALSHTEEEVRAVGRLYEARPGDAGPLDLLLGPGATKASVVDRLPSRRYVHLATHGFFRPSGPSDAFGIRGASSNLDSGIVLAGANPRPLEGILTAEEVAGLDLRGVELVTLSACESGLGHSQAGQGVVGLLGSLDRAGARSVLSSLWEVGDESTAALMERFYHHYWSDPSRSAAEALRRAQGDLAGGRVKSPSGASFADPQNWAAFFLSGDPGRPERPAGGPG